MDRRKFFSVTGAGAAAAAASGMAETASAQSRRYPATPGEACASAKLNIKTPIIPSLFRPPLQPAGRSRR